MASLIRPYWFEELTGYVPRCYWRVEATDLAIECHCKLLRPGGQNIGIDLEGLALASSIWPRLNHLSCLCQTTMSPKVICFFSDRLLPRSSGHTLLPRYLMNSLNYFDKTDRKYKSLLMTWLHSVGPGHSRPSRWRGHPRWRWVVEVPSSCWSKTDVTPAILSRDFVAR